MWAPVQILHVFIFIPILLLSFFTSRHIVFCCVSKFYLFKSDMCLYFVDVFVAGIYSQVIIIISCQSLCYERYKNIIGSKFDSMLPWPIYCIMWMFLVLKSALYLPSMATKAARLHLGAQNLVSSHWRIQSIDFGVWTCHLWWGEEEMTCIHWTMSVLAAWWLRTVQVVVAPSLINVLFWLEAPYNLANIWISFTSSVQVCEAHETGINHFSFLSVFW